MVLYIFAAMALALSPFKLFGKRSFGKSKFYCFAFETVFSSYVAFKFICTSVQGYFRGMKTVGRSEFSQKPSILLRKTEKPREKIGKTENNATANIN